MTGGYAEVPGWGAESWADDVTGVAVDARDRVYVLRRGADAVTVLDPDGAVLDRWGDPLFSPRPHLVSVGPDGTVHVADDHGHRVFAFDRTGRRRAVLGTGEPSGTGFDGSAGTEAGLAAMPGGPPFNRPTKAVAGPGGELFVSDGYRNCRIHRFSADGRLERSWGGPGAAPGRFVIPHSVALDRAGRVVVCDRENDRVQVFTRDGDLLDVWDDVLRPTDVAFDAHGRAHVAELPRGPLDLPSWRLGRAERERPGRVTVWSADHSSVVARIVPAAGFLAPHAVAVDSAGAVYVAEVPESFARSTGRPRRAHRCLHKFVPHP